MDRASIERLINESYAARARGDMAAVARSFSDNPRFELAGAPQASPVACCVEGGESFKAVVEAMMATWEWREYAIVSLMIDGNRAAVHWRAKLRHTGKNETVETEAVDLLTIENGRIAAFHEFCDTALAAKLMA